MEHIKVIGALILCLSILFPTNVAAEYITAENTNEKMNYTLIQNANEITDLDGLVSLALKQNNQKSNLSLNHTSKDPVLTAKQLLSTRQYANGSLEKDYSLTKIILSEDTISEYESGRAGITWVHSDKKNDSYSVPKYNVQTTFHYTVKEDLFLTPTYTFRVDKVVTVISKTGDTTTRVVGGDQMYKVASGVEKYQTLTWDDRYGSQQTFTLSSQHSGFYKSYNDLLSASISGVFAQSYVTFSDGSSVLLQFCAWDDSI